VTANIADADGDSVGTAGGVFAPGLEAGGSMQNSILAGNIDRSGRAPDCNAAGPSLGYNIIGDATGCTFTGSTGDQVGSLSAPIDPGLLALGNYGGPTQTQAPQATSPAINAGNPNGCTGLDLSTGMSDGTLLQTDQRGFPRTQDGRCDIGAVESAGAGCGNGTLEPGEQCDDGNAVNEDCCSSTCLFEAAGSLCTDDGEPCTADYLRRGRAVRARGARGTGLHCGLTQRVVCIA